MECDYFRFLIIETSKRGTVKVLFKTDEEQELNRRFHLYLDIFKNDINEGKVRIDIYKYY